MSKQLQPIQLDEFIRDAAKILDELQATDGELLLEDRGKVFRLAPKRAAKRPSKRRGQFTKDDPLYALGGAFASKEPTDVTNHKHEYLADAYGDLHRA